MQDIMRQCIHNATTDMRGCDLADYANTHNLQRMETIGDRLRRQREALGITQEELAKRIGRGQSTISRIEDGTTKDPDSKTLRAIARGLGITAEDLPEDPAVEIMARAPNRARAERDPSSAIDASEVESPLESAIRHAFNKNEHSLRDVDAVRAALRDTAQLQHTESDLIEMATWWLNVAARLRRRGDQVTIQSLLIETTHEKLSHAKVDASDPALGENRPRQSGS